jgi:Fur family ferric uptake transcriptional regulator
MDEKLYTQMRDQFTSYMTGKKLRRTEERYRIFEKVCAFRSHFDIDMLHDKLKEDKFHVSKATVYNTLEVIVDAGLLVPHQITSRAVQYELKHLADTHQHLICTKCGNIREIRTQALKADLKKLKISRFTPEFYCLYVYGICSKCRYRMRLKK